MSRLARHLIDPYDPNEGRTPIQRSEVAYLYLTTEGWEIWRKRCYNMSWFGPYKTVEEAEKSAKSLGFGSAKISRFEGHHHPR